MPKQDCPPLDRIFTDRTLALLFREMLRDEEHSGKSVPTTEARRLVSLYVQIGKSDRNLQRVLDRLTLEGYLREDRKGMCIHLVGYFCQTKATSHMHAHLNGQVIPDIPELTLSEIKKLAAPGAIPQAPRSIEELVPRPEDVAREEAIESARKGVEEAIRSLSAVTDSLRDLSADLARIEANREKKVGKAYDSTIQRLRLRIMILTAREQEEASRLTRAQERLSDIINQSD